MNKVKKVDVHCHVTMELEKFTNHFHDNTPILTKDEMRAIHEKLNVEMGVVSPLMSNEFVGSPATTENAVNVAQSDPAHYTWFCCIDPRNYDPSEIYGVLAKYKEMGDEIVQETRNEYPKGKVNEGRIPKLMREYGNLYSDLSAGSGSNALRRDS